MPLIPIDWFQWTTGEGYYDLDFDGAIMLAVTDLAGMDATRCIEERIYVYRHNLKHNVTRTRTLEYRARLFSDQCAHKPLAEVRA
jgi:hypothetical protein